MKLEQQVVSLELAKRLKELGVNQDGYFSWLHSNVTYPAGNTNTKWFVHHGLFNTEPYQKIDETASAFSVAELGEMLPHEYFSTKYSDGTFRCLVSLQAPGSEVEKDTESATEADARAKMLVYLIENKLMPVPDHDCHASSEDGCEVCGRREV